MLTYFIYFFVLVALVFSDAPIVKTTHGLVSGKVLKSLLKQTEYYGFMGIPYAAPPIGDLRFLPPQPIEPWEDTLKATREKSACFQFNHNVKKKQPLGQYGAEDCLYLDIFTPELDGENRAVIVFILNDHFLNSHNKTKDYAPDFFIEEDVVVVTITHRLAVLGFLSLQHEMLPGNSGLKDIVQGLEWVRDNIEQFGGDPKRITLMGVQGGAAGIDLLLYTKAKALFHGAILQSGTSWTSAYLQEDLRGRALKLVELISVPSTNNIKVLKDLQAASPYELVARDLHSSPSDYFKETQRSVVAFAPIVENQPDGLLIEYPEDSKIKINIPIMMGFNSLEGMEASFQYLLEPRYLFFLKKDFPLLLPRRLRFKFDPLRQVFADATEEVKDFYMTKGKINIKSTPDMIKLMGDCLTTYAMNFMAGVYSERSLKSIYYYHFDYSGVFNENKNNIMKMSTVELDSTGAATGDELCYLFKCPDLKNEYVKHAEDMTEDRTMQIKMIRMWTNFAKYGNPTPDSDETLGGLKWQPYNLESKQYLNIDKDITMKTDLYKERFDFWDSFITKWENRAVDGLVSESANKKDEL